MTMPDPSSTPKAAGLFRRLAALFYDSFLLLAVWFIAIAIVLPLNQGKAFAPHNPWLTTYLMFVAFFFYGWFWMHGGQTLGMRAWKLQLRNLRPGPLSWWQILLRFLAAAVPPAVGALLPATLVLSAIGGASMFGIVYLWMLVDRKHLTLHDRLSETTIVRLEKNPHRH